MVIDGALLTGQIKPFAFEDYIRIIPSKHAATPLGCTPGSSRFGGTDESFAVLYAARDLATALAETVIRDRFQGLSDRRLFEEELVERTAVQIHASGALRLVDLRKDGCLKLGVSTDITGAKGHLEAQQFSQFVHQQAMIDGILYASRLTGENCVAIFDHVIATHLVAGDVIPLPQLENLIEALTSLNIQLIR